MKQISLAEIATELRINKSKLAYYFQLNLLNPIAKVGRMNVFDRAEVLRVVKKIGDLKKKGKSLKEIRSELK